MKNKIKIQALSLCLILCFAFALPFVKLFAKENKTNYTYAKAATIADEDNTTFNIPMLYNTETEKSVPAFILSETTSTGTDYIYPTTGLPKSPEAIMFAKPITIKFEDLAEANDQLTYEENIVKSFKLTYANSLQTIGEKTITKTSTPDASTTTFDKTVAGISNGITLTIDIEVDKLVIINNQEQNLTYTTTLKLKYYTAKKISAENSLTDKDDAEHQLFTWNIESKTNSSFTQINIPEPIFNQTYGRVTLTFSEIIRSVQDKDNPDIYNDVDVGINQIRINGTSYNIAKVIDDPATPEMEPHTGEKYVEFSASGDYVIEILSNEYQDGINKEYTYKKYCFTIDNTANIVAYSTETGAEILNFDGSTRYQFVSGSVTLKFWGIAIGENIDYDFKSNFKGGSKAFSFTLTEEYLNNGYILKDSGEYTIKSTNSDINKTLKFGVCNSILKVDEVSAISGKLTAFAETSEGESTKMTSSTTISTISSVEDYVTYTVSGLSLQFGSNANITTPNSYKYNFTVNRAKEPIINISPQLSNGKSTTDNIVVDKPTAAGNWTLTISYGDTTKTYTKSNFDKITLSENSRYTIVVTDETGQSYQLTVAKNFKMNTASIILIIIGILGSLVLVIGILKTRVKLQVK